MLFSKETIIFQDSRGDPIFSKGAGSNSLYLLKPIELVILQGGPDSGSAHGHSGFFGSQRASPCYFA